MLANDPGRIDASQIDNIGGLAIREVLLRASQCRFPKSASAASPPQQRISIMLCKFSQFSIVILPVLRSLNLKRCPYPLPRRLQRFRQNSRLTDRRHETRIAGPPGKRMHVYMPRNPRSGAAADIET